MRGRAVSASGNLSWRPRPLSPLENKDRSTANIHLVCTWPWVVVPNREIAGPALMAHDAEGSWVADGSLACWYVLCDVHRK